MHQKPAAEQLEIALRRVQERDLPTLHSFECDPAANELAGVKPRTREVFMARWRDVIVDPKINVQVIVPAGEPEGEVLGSISVFQAEGRDNIGYWISRAHWGKRVASRAVAMFLAMEGRRPLHATAAADNTASRRVLTHHGFRLIRERWAEETERYCARQIVEMELE